MYRPTIAVDVGDLTIYLKGIPTESLALSGMGVFDCPIVSAWQVCTQSGMEVGLVIEYLHMPATWGDEKVKIAFRRIHPDHRNTPIPQSLLWVRILPGAQPAFARSRDEAMLLFDLDLQLALARHESSEEPMNPAS